jgi:hypothetical protein
MSETYPDDIMKAARAIAHVVFIAGPDQDDLADAIASALLAERERCAKIALAQVPSRNVTMARSPSVHFDPSHVMARKIAALIRATATCPTSGPTAGSTEGPRGA